jgi:hypothetical protein
MPPGAVHLLSPTLSQLSPHLLSLDDFRLAWGAQVLAGSAAVPGSGEPGDRFGAAVAGDLTPTAVPTWRSARQGGTAPEVGSRSFRATAGPDNRVLSEGTFAGQTARPGERFGQALDVGDFDADGGDELAIGVPRERVTATGRDQGAVVIVNGRSELAVPPADGLLGAVLTAESPGLPGRTESGDGLGAALAVGDVDGDTVDDLAIGAPGENGDRGSLLALYGRPGNGLAGQRARPATELSQDSADVAGVAEPGDRSGAAVSVGVLVEEGFPVVVVGPRGPGGRCGRGGQRHVPWQQSRRVRRQRHFPVRQPGAHAGLVTFLVNPSGQGPDRPEAFTRDTPGSRWSCCTLSGALRFVALLCPA